MTTRSDVARRALGFLTVEATDALNDDGIVVLDPGSALIAARAVIDAGVLIYPNVTIECDDGGDIAVGADTRVYPGCLLSARGGARIEIGARCELGPWAVHIHADHPGDLITLQDEVRVSHGCELSGSSRLGRGSQILGPVIARSVCLTGGRGGHRWPDPDARGAVLKGAGIADGLTLASGEVRSCRASFADAPSESQTSYHPQG